MKIKFCGAATGVTGSCHLIEGEGHRILLDCGQFQGGRAQEKLNAEPFLFDIDQIEDVVLSHAHIDRARLRLGCAWRIQDAAGELWARAQKI